MIDIKKFEQKADHIIENFGKPEEEIQLKPTGYVTFGGKAMMAHSLKLNQKYVDSLSIEQLEEVMKGFDMMISESPFKHEGKVLTTQEVMDQRSNAYEFIDLLDNETLNRIRSSQSDAEARRILKQSI